MFRISNFGFVFELSYYPVLKRLFSLMMTIFSCLFVWACSPIQVKPEFLSVLSCPADSKEALGQSIEWKIPVNEVERTTLESWCKGVGLPVILMPSGVEAKTEPIDSLIVVSWNVHVGGAEVDQFISDLRRGSLTGGEPVHHFVLLLQEAFRVGPSVPVIISPDTRSASFIRAEPPSEVRIDIVEIARRHRLGLYYVPSMRNGAQGQTTVPEDRGNAILSTLSIFSLVAVELPHERQRRVAIGANLSGKTPEGASWELQLLNAHLENRSRWRRIFNSFGTARRRQMTALLEAFPGDIPTVLGGDFNTWFRGTRESVITYVQQFFDQPAYIPSSGTLKSGFLLPERTVDYLFFRLPEGWNGCYERVNNSYGSDHYPLLGRIHIGSSPGE
jgi:endonuclease/exonuclease/phosphatase family metal-dependent hydrolase